MGKISWVCDWCGKLLELKEHFYLVQNRQIDKKGLIKEYNGIFFYCKKCIKLIGD